jgi:hypothetical protein
LRTPACRAHDGVVVEKSARVVAVGTDSADMSGEMHDYLRAEVSVHATHISLAREIVFLARER